MIRHIFLFGLVFLLALSCAKAPEKTDIEELIGEISGEVEAERAAKCGDGVVDEWEECDFEKIHSCSENDSEQIGPLTCESCKLLGGLCYEKNECRQIVCSGRGECIENKYYDYEVSCECFDKYAGANCEKCKEGFHFDFDGEGIDNKNCTLIGCEGKNEKCKIVDNSATCGCNPPWTGENCEECEYRYYLEDGKCKSKYCFSTEIVCEYYEKCFDENEKAECLCAGKNQNPDDCSKCLPGYGWIDHGDFCVNELEVACEHNPEAPENSVDSLVVTITYTDENGWSEPEYCEWECKDGYYLENGECVKT